MKPAPAERAWRESSRAAPGWSNNDALEDDEVAEGWMLTCQALPTSRAVHVIYE